MNFLIYQKNHKDAFNTLSLQYIDAGEFLIEVTITVEDDVGAVLTRHPGAAAHMQEATRQAVAVALAEPLNALKRWLARRERVVGKAQFDAAETLRLELLREFQDRRAAIIARVSRTAAKVAVDDIAGFMAKSGNAAALDVRRRAVAPGKRAASAEPQVGDGAASIDVIRGANVQTGTSGVQAITDGVGKTGKEIRTRTISCERLLQRAKRRLEAAVAACETEECRAKQAAKVAGGRGKHMAADGITNIAGASRTMVVNLIAALKGDVDMLDAATAHVRHGFDRLSQRLPGLLDAQDELRAELVRLDGKLVGFDDVDGRAKKLSEEIGKTKKKLAAIEEATARILPKIERFGALIFAEEEFIGEYHQRMKDLEKYAAYEAME